MPERATPEKRWARVAFGDVVRQVRDRVDPEKSSLERFVAGEHMDSDQLRIRRWGTIGASYLGPAFHMRFKPGQVLYGSRRTYLRKVALADFEGITANTTFVLEPKDPQSLLPGLLPFIMQTDSFHEHSVKQSKGSVNPYINFSDLAWYEFALPPIEEQRRLVKILDAARDLEERLFMLLASLRVVRESWLDHEFSSLVREWPEKLASDLIGRITVGIVVKPADLYVPASQGVPALRSLNILPGRVAMDDLVHISREGHGEHEKSRLTPGDVVIVRSGRPGDAAVVPEGIGELNCIDLIICGTSPELDPHFLCAAVNSIFGRRQLSAEVAGTAQQHLNVGAFKSFRIPVPPPNLQAQFVCKLHSLIQLIAEAERRLSDVRRVRADFMRSVFQV